jgi:general secretion pathway protein G
VRPQRCDQSAVSCRRRERNADLFFPSKGCCAPGFLRISVERLAKGPSGVDGVGMNNTTVRFARRRAFTLVELIVIIVVLAILSGVAIPKYLDYTANAKSSVGKATLGAVRSAVVNFYAASNLTGAATYPTLVQLQTLGGVMQETIPPNPYNNSTLIAAATWAATPPVSGVNGYNYDVAAGKFWMNSNTAGVTENTW